MKKLLFVVLMLLATAASADYSVYLGAWSYHAPWATYDYQDEPDGSFNETHNLVAVKYDGWGFGHYKNSYRHDSYFISRELVSRQWGSFRPSVHAIIVTGYQDCLGIDKLDDICPALSAELAYTRWDIQPVLMFLDPTSIAIGVKYQF